MSNKIGRNAPCPCGSGAKYKKCCATKEQNTAVAAPSPGSSMAQTPLWFFDDDDLDELSNRVVSLINAGRLAEAETVYEELKRKHPDAIDVPDRGARLLEAKGDLPGAAALYREAARHARSNPEFEPEVTTMFEEMAANLDARSRESA